MQGYAWSAWLYWLRLQFVVGALCVQVLRDGFVATWGRHYERQKRWTKVLGLAVADVSLPCSVGTISFLMARSLAMIEVSLQ